MRPTLAITCALLVIALCHPAYSQVAQSNPLAEPSDADRSSLAPGDESLSHPVDPIRISGIFPHLAIFNDEAECGTGAVVPWADRLWVISYGPHLPFGSSDKLYEITPDLRRFIRPESVGGTHANRMIHRESQQLIIGPYFIDADRRVRVITPQHMPGRLTGNARHLSEPAAKVYFTTMEEGLYEVDVKTLEVTGLIKDSNRPKPGQTSEQRPATLFSELPGYHGKGTYSGQGRVIYANNGEYGEAAKTDPTIPSGALAEWRGNGDWQLVRRNQFTEVSGPGDITGNADPEEDPVWSVGWDSRSLILMLLDGGKWHPYRLPKASHAYDGAHGWNTEWPRIRDIQEEQFLMTMHGMFWRFPKTFRASSSAGIEPRSSYLKVVGDFCRWQDQIVCGCDDTAKSAFLNTRKAKGRIAAPGQSQSNLWFLDPAMLDKLGPALGRGAVWLEEAVKGNVPSDPYLFSGFANRSLHLVHGQPETVTFQIEVDASGDGQWKPLRSLVVPPHGYAWTEFTPSEAGAWVRLKADRDCSQATAFFHYRNNDPRGLSSDSIFDGIAKSEDRQISEGLLHALGANRKTLLFAARDGSRDLGAYELDGSLKLKPLGHAEWVSKTASEVAIPKNVLAIDSASVLYEDDTGRWRLPKGNGVLEEASALGEDRVCREVCTERDLFNACGTFYELPADNAGGFAAIRPIASHNFHINDFVSYRGLLVMSGISRGEPKDNRHIIRSSDGRCALWVGAVDDLWQLGKPRGVGGPWRQSDVKADKPSDPYLMTGYDKKKLTLSHGSDKTVSFQVQVDIAGTGSWQTYRDFPVEAGQSLTHTFSDAFTAYWVRLKCNSDCTASAEFVYE